MTKSKHVVVADDENFDAEVLASERPVLVDFGATWCAPCRALAPIVDKLADEHAGVYKVVVVDIDDAPAVAKRYAIRSAPTLLVFKGGERRAQHVGLTNRETLLGLLRDA